MTILTLLIILIQAPIIPTIASPTDTSNFDTYEDEPNESRPEVAMSPKGRRKISSYDIPFIGYTYRYWLCAAV